MRCSKPKTEREGRREPTLHALYDEQGQSPWLDNLKRGYLTSGQLAKMVDEGIRGLTSNPTILQKAISGSADYDEQFKVLAVDDHPVLDDYWALVMQDINGALDVFAPALRGERRRRRVRVGRGRTGRSPATRKARSTRLEASTRRSIAPTCS